MDPEPLTQVRQAHRPPLDRVPECGVTPCTLNPGPWTLEPEPWTLDPGPWTLKPTPPPSGAAEREFFIDNLMVRIDFIIGMMLEDWLCAMGV